MFVTILHILAIVLAACGGAAPPEAGVTPTPIEWTHLSSKKGNTCFFVGDFETGDLTGFRWTHNDPKVVAEGYPVRAGTYSMMCYLHRYESNYPERTEVYPCEKDTDPEHHCSHFNFTIGKEYWIGFSVYILSDWVIDKPGLTGLVLNIQAVPDAGETWRSPVLAISIDEDRMSWLTHAESLTTNVFYGTVFRQQY